MRILVTCTIACFFALAACKKKEADKPAPKPTAAPAPAPAPTPAPAPAPTPKAVTAQDAAKIFATCWDHFNQRAWDKFSACYAPNAVTTTAGHAEKLEGRAAIVEKGAKMFVSAFPDIRGEAQLTLIADKRVSAIVWVRGTHKGPLPTPNGPVPATQKKIGMLMFQEIEFNDKGEAVKEHTVSDDGTMMAQLGLAKQPHRPATTEGAKERPVVIGAGGPSEAANIEATKKYYETFNRRDMAALLAMTHQDAVEHIEPEAKDNVGLAAIEKSTKGLWTGFPDVKLTPESMWAAGDYTVTRVRFTGTNTGGKKATGKKVDVPAIEVMHWQGGKLKYDWVFFNGLEFAMQMGLVPAPKK
jgi:predicted ester cyclase